MRDVSKRNKNKSLLHAIFSNTFRNGDFENLKGKKEMTIYVRQIIIEVVVFTGHQENKT